MVGGVFFGRDLLHFKKDGRDVDLNAYEVSGAVVEKTEYGGKGIYKGLLETVHTLLAQSPDHVDLVFAFSNVREPAVLKTAGQIGRTLVTETAQELNLLIPHPAMQQNTVNGELVDDVVTYLQGKFLAQISQQ